MGPALESGPLFAPPRTFQMHSKFTGRVLHALSFATFVGGVALIGWTSSLALDSFLVQWSGTRHLDRAIKLTAAGGGADRPERAFHPRRGSVLGRLQIPRLKMSLIILEGADSGTLDKSIGHVVNTGLPGGNGNVGIAGHRNTHFRDLERIRRGDEIVLTTAKAQLKYRVEWIGLYEPQDVYVLDPSHAPALTLITCFPFEYVGRAPQRFVVRALPDDETRARLMRPAF